MDTDVTTQRRHLAFKAIMVILVLITIEIGVRIAAYCGFCNIRNFQTVDHVKDITFLGDINPYFGVWHLPNTTVRISTPRGQVTYETNSYGMRDRFRAEKSNAPERVVVLGDSFIEGAHVEQSDRITDVLERRSGVEFLNFGTSGCFGSIQEWLLYKHLAKRFDHTRVCIFLLPDNDFTDNDPTKHSPKRYRPYLDKVDGSYAVRYPTAFNLTSNRLFELSRGQKVRHRLYNHWYTLNLLVQRDLSDITDVFRTPLITSSYDRYTPEDLERLLFTYNQILDLAKPRPVYVFIIPRDADFMAYETGRFEGRIASALSAFAKDKPEMTVVDLLPYLVAYAKQHQISYKRFFLGFDPHWSPLGHRVSADCVLQALQHDRFKALPTKAVGGDSVKAADGLHQNATTAPLRSFLPASLKVSSF